MIKDQRICVGAWTGHQRQWSMANWSQTRTWSTDIIGVCSSWFWRTLNICWRKCVKMCSSGRLNSHKHRHNLDRFRGRLQKILTKSMYEEEYHTECERMCAFSLESWTRKSIKESKMTNCYHFRLHSTRKAFNFIR